MNLPNCLTIFRMVAAFVFLYYGLMRRWEIAFPIFCVAAVTDMVDGSLARLMRQRTRLGAILDPAADKLLMLLSFVALTRDRYLPLLLTALIIGRDLLIVGGMAFLSSRGIRIVVRPTYLSKTTTFFQIVTIFFTLLMAQNPARAGSADYSSLVVEGAPGTNLIRGVTVLLTMATGIQYFRIGWRMLQNEKTKTDRQ